MVVNSNIIYMFGRAKTDHWCAMPAELDFTDTLWKELAIPHKTKSEDQGCQKSGELNMNEKYDKCHTFDINFIELHQYSNNYNNSGKSNYFQTSKGIVFGI
jgi:hypothetical protein